MHATQLVTSVTTDRFVLLLLLAVITAPTTTIIINIIITANATTSSPIAQVTWPSRVSWNFLIVHIGAINCATFLYGFGVC